jgi:hypothetical protein
VSVDVPVTGTSTWSYPSLQGHTLAVGDGTTFSGLRIYDPFGQPIDPTTLAIGTTNANDSGVLNETSGWHQSAQKIAETAGSTLLIEMGARLYVPVARLSFTDGMTYDIRLDDAGPKGRLALGKNRLHEFVADVRTTLTPASDAT